jgi:integrase
MASQPTAPVRGSNQRPVSRRTPARTPDTIPKLQCCGPRRVARVKLNGIHVYFGRYGTPEASLAYDRAIEAWIANGRSWPPPAREVETVEQLGDRFAQWARSYYAKAGKLTSSALQIEHALALLYRSGAARTASGEPLDAEDFGPRELQQFRAWLCLTPGQPYNRRTINNYTAAVAAMFRWGASESLVVHGRWRDLQAVKGLRRGRSPGPGIPPPREGGRVDPVPDQVLAATLEHAGPMLRAMVQLQLLTGMRPTEVLGLRPRNLVPTVDPRVMAYQVPGDSNKLDHHDIERTVYIGPRGMAILRPWLNRLAPDAFVFSPRASLEIFNAARRQSRRAPGAHWPSHSREARAARKPAPVKPAAPAGDRYSTDSYRRAIARAAERAGVEAWGPGRLRHNAASYITEHEKVEVAQLLLGHRHITTTMRYVQVPDRRAVKAALKHG